MLSYRKHTWFCFILHISVLKGLNKEDPVKLRTQAWFTQPFYHRVFLGFRIIDNTHTYSMLGSMFFGDIPWL